MSLNKAYGTDNSYGKELKESIIDVITQLSPKKTPLYTLLGRSKASGSLHQFLEYTTNRASSTGAVAEGADSTFTDLTSPSRNTNYVQEIEETFSVTQKQIDSENYGKADPFEWEKARAMERWKLKAEYSVVHGTGVSGGSGAAWEMKGLKTVITTNYTSVASGTSLTEDLYNNVLETMWADVDDDRVWSLTDIKLKRAITAFSASERRNMDFDGNGAKLTWRIDMYDSDVAQDVAIMAHRDIATSDKMIINIQPAAYKIAHLREPESQERAKTGAYDKGVIYGSLTLEYRFEKASSILRNVYHGIN